MYPLIRLAKEVMIQRKAPRIGMFDTHVSHHLCWPVDIDVWREMNNGRTLTLFDLGRTGLFLRTGVISEMARQKWSGTVAGSSVRYRRRVRMFDRVEMRSRLLGWDARFLYVEQSMWRQGDCTSQALLRTAVTSRTGLVPMAEVAAVFGPSVISPTLPDWVTAWIAAEDRRPWPPLH